MKNSVTILTTNRSGNILALSIVIIFGLLAILRLYPFENDLLKILIEIDDWSRYAKNALEIKNAGILMSQPSGNYFSPAGFLYNYFIAACFYCFGENTVPVYILQNLLLGISVALTYWTFRDKMKPLTALVLLLTLFIFALLDVYKNYSFRLLSENLAIFTISAFVYCFSKGLEKNKLSLLLTSAVFMGLSILTRPNIFPFGVILLAIISFYFWKQKQNTLRNILLFASVLLASSSFLLIRNHLVCGSWTFLPTEGITFSQNFFNDDGPSITLYFKKILFFFGILSPLEPNYSWRPHWTMMWIGFFTYLYFRLRSKQKFDIWEVTLLLFILIYFGVLLLIAQVDSYGFRLIIPITFVVLPFSFMAVDRLITRHHNH